jgi:hypothetical protein
MLVRRSHEDLRRCRDGSCSTTAPAWSSKRLTDAQRDGIGRGDQVRPSPTTERPGSYTRRASWSGCSHRDGARGINAWIGDHHLVEAHGTATLSTPVEISLTRAFRAEPSAAASARRVDQGNFRHQPRRVAGLIRRLSRYAAARAESLLFDRPNPNIDFSATPFFVQTAHGLDAPAGGYSARSELVRRRDQHVVVKSRRRQ